MTNPVLLAYIRNLIHQAKTERCDYITLGNYLVRIDAGDTLIDLLRGLDAEWDTNTIGEIIIHCPMYQADIMLERIEMMSI